MSPAELHARLAHLLPSDSLAHLRSIASVAVERQVRAYLVGGAIRDAVTGNDWTGTRPDVTVVAPIGEFVDACQRRIADSRIRYISEYETARLDIGESVIELATARRDVYDPPGSMPQVEPVDSIGEDLPRRDFTVNAMAIELLPDGFGELIDPLGGEADCRDRVLRLTRLGSGAFRDDPTRILRGVKLAARCDMRFEEATAAELQGALPDLVRLYDAQPARVWKEWRQYFDPREKLRAIFEIADGLGVLRALKLTWRVSARKEWLDVGHSGLPADAAVSLFGATLPGLRWDGILEMYRLMPLPKNWRNAIWTAVEDASSSGDPEDAADRLASVWSGLEVIDREIARRA